MSDDVTDEAHPKTTGLEDGLFGSDDEDEDNNTIKDVTSTELEKAIKEIGSHDADAFETWRPKNWYSALTEKLGIDFTAQPELKDKVMDLIEKIITVEEPNKDSSLFGSDEDSDIDARPSSKQSKGKSTGDQTWYSDEEEDDTIKPERKVYEPKKIKTESELELPEPIRFDPEQDLMYIKLPPGLYIQADPFNRNSYSYDEEEIEFANQVESSNKNDTEPSAENFFKTNACIRWRNKLGPNGNPLIGSDGRPIRESNARFILFADGTKKLIVGSKEYDVEYLSFESRYLFTRLKSTSDDNLHLECIGKVQHKTVFNALERKTFYSPSTASKQKIKVYDGIENPEKMKESQIKEQELRFRKDERLKQLQLAQQASGSKGRSMMSSSYLEEEDNEMKFDSTSLKALKKQAKTGKLPREKVLDDSYDDDDVSDEDDDEARSEDGENDDDDSFIAKSDEEDVNDKVAEKDILFEQDEEEPSSISTSRQKVARTVIEDDDEDDKDFIQSVKRSRKSVLNDSDDDE